MLGIFKDELYLNGTKTKRSQNKQAIMFPTYIENSPCIRYRILILKRNSQLN